MSNSDRIIADRTLTDFARDLFSAAGVPPEDAALIARVLVWSNLRGVDLHGVLRIPGYLERVRKVQTTLRPTSGRLPTCPPPQF